MNKSIEHLQKAIQCQTISYSDRTLIDFKEYDKFLAFLKEAYPNVHQKAEHTSILKYSQIYKIKGSTQENPIAFMAHYDVVPVSDQWTNKPFGAEIKDDYVYGRGTLDMKGHLVAMMEAMESLLSSGIEFDRDVYILLGHNEETGSSINDSGAYACMKHLEAQNIKFHAVMDEGGAFMQGSSLGIEGQIALIGLGEKGYLDVNLSAKASGGHASMPPEHSALYDIFEAGMKIEDNKFSADINPATDQMFEHLYPHMKQPLRFLFKNRKLFKPLLLRALVKNPMTAAIVRTTSVVTMAQGSKAPNVLAQEAQININCRLVPGDTVERTLKRIQSLVGPNIQVKQEIATNPTSVSPSNHRVFRILQETIQSYYPQFKVVAPYLMIAATDSRVYHEHSEAVYRICPFAGMAEDLHTVHADDERIKIEDFEKGIEFFKQVILKSSQKV